MITLFFLALMQAPSATAAPPLSADGIVFRCGLSGSPGFELFAPGPQSGTDPAALPSGYRVSGIAMAGQFESVSGSIPGPIVLTWRREHNSPVSLEIRDYDAGAGTAAYTLRSERNPSSRLFTPVKMDGSCTAERATPEQQETNS